MLGEQVTACGGSQGGTCRLVPAQAVWLTAACGTATYSKHFTDVNMQEL